MLAQNPGLRNPFRTASASAPARENPSGPDAENARFPRLKRTSRRRFPAESRQRISSAGLAAATAASLVARSPRGARSTWSNCIVASTDKPPSRDFRSASLPAARSAAAAKRLSPSPVRLPRFVVKNGSVATLAGTASPGPLSATTILSRLRAESCRTATETTDAPARMEFSSRSSTCSDKSRIRALQRGYRNHMAVRRSARINSSKTGRRISSESKPSRSGRGRGCRMNAAPAVRTSRASALEETSGSRKSRPRRTLLFREQAQLADYAEQRPVEMRGNGQAAVPVDERHRLGQRESRGRRQHLRLGSDHAPGRVHQPLLDAARALLPGFQVRQRRRDFRPRRAGRWRVREKADDVRFLRRHDLHPGDHRQQFPAACCVAAAFPALLWSQTAIIASPHSTAAATIAGGVMSGAAHGERAV